MAAARRQAEQVTGEALGPLTEQRDELQRHISGLRALALELRGRLRAYADEPLPGLDADPGDEETIQIGQMLSVPAGGITASSGNGSTPGAVPGPAAHQEPDPAARATRTGNGQARPKETGSPAAGLDSEQPADIQLPGCPLVGARQPAQHPGGEFQQPGPDLRDLLRGHPGMTVRGTA